MSSVQTTSGIRAHRSARAEAEALRTALAELAEFIAALSDRQYASRPDERTSSIGAHVRHCLDHVVALVAGIAMRRVDYDQRERGTSVEYDRRAALRAMGILQNELVNLSRARATLRLHVRVLLSHTGPWTDSGSTVSRELSFVLSHTIHHAAMIASLARTLGAPAPPALGVAPATRAHGERSVCVRSA